MLIIHTTVNVLYVFVSEGEIQFTTGGPAQTQERKKWSYVMGNKANHFTTVPCMVILVVIIIILGKNC